MNRVSIGRHCCAQSTHLEKAWYEPNDDKEGAQNFRAVFTFHRGYLHENIGGVRPRDDFRRVEL